MMTLLYSLCIIAVIGVAAVSMMGGGGANRALEQRMERRAESQRRQATVTTLNPAPGADAVAHQRAA